MITIFNNNAITFIFLSQSINRIGKKIVKIIALAFIGEISFNFPAIFIKGIIKMKRPSVLIKSIFSICFFSLNATVHAAQAEDHAAIVASAAPMIKKAVQVLDEKVVDSMIVTACAGYGSAAGNCLSISMMEKISLMTGGRGYFNANERYEDDMGRVLGMVVGYHAGQYLVYLRHKITDPLFPRIYDLGAASVNAGKVLCENTVGWISGYTCDKVKKLTDYLNDYVKQEELVEKKIN